MPLFAPKKYVVQTDNRKRDYHEYLNEYDPSKIIEVSEEHANQVMRKQPQWMEIKHEETVKEATKEVLIEPKVESAVEKVIKKMGRPKKSTFTPSTLKKDKG